MDLKFLYSLNEDVNERDVLDQIKNARKRATDRRDTVGFAMEDSNGKIVKVFVRAAQAQDFEKALARAQHEHEEEDGEIEIAEVLFDLHKSFDIVDVEWQQGAIPEDEEVDNMLQGDESDESEDDVEGLGDFSDVEGEDLDAALDGAENAGAQPDDAYSALKSVIDMLKANAEAEKAKADAQKAQAEKEIAVAANQAATMRAKQEEEILDMDDYNKRKKEEEEMRATREKLIKYRHETKNSNNHSDLGESMKHSKYDGPTPEEEELLDMEKWEEEERDRARAKKERERLVKFRYEKKRKRKKEEEEMRKRVHNYMESVGLNTVKDVSFMNFLSVNKKKAKK